LRAIRSARTWTPGIARRTGRQRGRPATNNCTRRGSSAGVRLKHSSDRDADNRRAGRRLLRNDCAARVTAPYGLRSPLHGRKHSFRPSIGTFRSRPGGVLEACRSLTAKFQHGLSDCLAFWGGPSGPIVLPAGMASNQHREPCSPIGVGLTRLASCRPPRLPPWDARLKKLWFSGQSFFIFANRNLLVSICSSCPLKVVVALLARSDAEL